MKVRDCIFRVLDTETTGVEPENGDKVVEVGYVDWSPVSGIVGHFESLINPGRDIPPTSSAIHQLTAKHVEDAPNLEDVLPDLVLPPNYIPVAHNAKFDAAFFVGSVANDLAIPDKWLCTYRMAAHKWPDAPGHSNQVLRYWLELEVPEAEAIAAHRALADCWVTARILEAAISDMLDVDVEKILERVAQPILQSKIRFGKHRGAKWSEVPTDYLQWMDRKGAFDEDVMYTCREELRRRRAP
jgi:exodeoxyribonuclease X